MASQIHRQFPKKYQNRKKKLNQAENLLFSAKNSNFKEKQLQVDSTVTYSSNDSPKFTNPPTLATMPHRCCSEAKQTIKNRNPKGFSSPSSISGGMDDDDPSFTAAVPAMPPWRSITGSRRRIPRRRSPCPATPAAT